MWPAADRHEEQQLQALIDSSPLALGARATLADAGEELALALAELRELARGLHPAVLTDRGLRPAVEMLVGRSPVPVEIAEMPEERLPEGDGDGGDGAGGADPVGGSGLRGPADRVEALGGSLGEPAASQHPAAAPAA